MAAYKDRQTQTNKQKTNHFMNYFFILLVFHELFLYPPGPRWWKSCFNV